MFLMSQVRLQWETNGDFGSHRRVTACLWKHAVIPGSRQEGDVWALPSLSQMHLQRHAGKQKTSPPPHSSTAQTLRVVPRCLTRGRQFVSTTTGPTQLHHTVQPEPRLLRKSGKVRGMQEKQRLSEAGLLKQRRQAAQGLRRENG